MHSFTDIVIVLVVVAIFYCMATVLSRAAQPLRLRMATLGENLLVDPKVTEPFKTHLEFLLDRAFTMRGSLIFTVVFIPFMSAIYVFRARWLSPYILDERDLPASIRDEYIEICNLHNKITLANHPILYPIVNIEIHIFMSAAVLLRGIMKGFLEFSVDGKTVMRVLEKNSNLLRKIHAA